MNTTQLIFLIICSVIAFNAVIGMTIAIVDYVIINKKLKKTKKELKSKYPDFNPNKYSKSIPIMSKIKGKTKKKLYRNTKTDLDKKIRDKTTSDYIKNELNISLDDDIS